MIFERYAFENLRNCIGRVKNSVYKKVCDFDMEIYKSKEPLTFDNRKTGEYKKVKCGDKWGDLFDCAWFHFTAELDSSVKGKKVVYVIDINGEGLIFDDDGCPVRGVTNVNSVFDRAHGNPGKRIIPFSENANGGEKIDFWMDAGCNDLAGNLQENGTVKEAYAATCNETARKLFYDMTVLFIQAETAPQGDPVLYELINVLSKCRKILSRYTDEEFEECLKITSGRLQATAGENPALSLTAFGHAHIDLAWLWPLRETRRKGARTFSTALELMKRYPEYLFGSSSPQLYMWVKEDYPQLYEKVKKCYESGRWELLGAMWVEPDLNLISGESVVRQLLYGNEYWEKEFGERVNFVWTPDTFGYSAALPQIFKKSGIDFFSTIKMSWNLINDFPYTNFIWRGIDGSEVLVHMPPEGSYVSEGTAKSVQNVKKTLSRNQQFGEALLPYGIGDGGGGPSPCHLEYLKREKNLPGLCPINQGKMKDFFSRFAKRRDDFPVWDGELYLERHLGVYTSAARNKKYNRLMESTLRDAEILSSIAFAKFGFDYPQEEIDGIWKETLLYQFHDVLPGSSIQRVYDESLERYEVLYGSALKIRDRAAALIAKSASGEGMKNPAVFINTLSFERDYIYNTDAGYRLIRLPAMGYKVVDLGDGGESVSDMKTLENRWMKVTLNDDGSIADIYNKSENAGLLRGASNIPYIYDDIENAWNLQYDYRNQTPERATFAGSRTVCGNSGVKVIQNYKYNNSEIEVTLSLGPESRVLEISVSLDWHEKHKMLRFAFDTDIDAGQVTCETQFGSVSRSAKNNTKTEQAQIEIAAHRWISVRRDGLQFAVLNDSKYGYSVDGNVIELNAIRGTDYPAHNLDFGKHTFRYGIYSDAATSLSGTVRKGYEFNFEPVICEPGTGDGNREYSFAGTDAESVIIDGIKKAQNGNSLVIRTYEAAGKKVNSTLKLDFSDNIRLCDLAEQIIGEAPETLQYKPFEINSFMAETR